MKCNCMATHEAHASGKSGDALLNCRPLWEVQERPASMFDRTARQALVMPALALRAF